MATNKSAIGSAIGSASKSTIKGWNRASGGGVAGAAPADWFDPSDVGDAFTLNPSYANMYTDLGVTAVTADAQQCRQMNSLGVGTVAEMSHPSGGGQDADTVEGLTGFYLPFDNGYVRETSRAFSGNWTIGMNLAVKSAAGVMFMKNSSSQDLCYVDASNNIIIYDGAGVQKSVVGSPLTNSQHKAIVWKADGTSFKVFINGVLALDTTGTAYSSDAGCNLYLGNDGAGAARFMHVTDLMYNMDQALSDDICAGGLTTWLGRNNP